MISDKMLKVIHENNLENKVLIWGACKKFEPVVKELKEKGIEICGYIDKNYKTTPKYNGVNVYDKDIIKKDKYFVYVGLFFYQDIIDYFNENNYVEHRDYWCPNHSIVLDGTKDYSDEYGRIFQRGGGGVRTTKPLKISMAENTELYIGDNTVFNGRTVINIQQNSVVKIGNNNSYTDDLEINAISNGSVSIGDNCKFENSLLDVSGGMINIGNSCSFRKNLVVRCGKYGNVVIGDDCMISSDTIIQSSNNHNLYDIETGENLNYNYDNKKDIIINKHVWIGEHAVIFSGANLGKGSVVGINTFVNKKFPNNSCVAGNPARIVRNKVAWLRDDMILYDDYEDFEKFDFTKEPE